MTSLAPQAWHQSSPEAVLERLGSSRDGLSEGEAGTRLARHGPNALRQEDPIRPLDLLLGQFKNLLVWILAAAAVVSGALGEWMDCVAILAIVVLNAVIGFVQEYHAEKSLAALKRMTAPRARVRREGRSRMIPATEVVPGDVLELEAGDLVPADARLLEAASLKHVESALTGESEGVEKDPFPLDPPEVPLGDRRNMAFMGTAVAAGAGLAAVVGTGMDTEIGRIATLLENASREDVEEETPLQHRLEAFGRVLVWASLGIVGLVFVLGWLRHLPLLDLFLTSVSLAVAAVPEGLPAVVTIALAVGVQRMAKRRALVRKLASVETLGSTNVICSDKTGTLTMGEMTVRELQVSGEGFSVSGEGYAPEGAVLFSGKPPGPEQGSRLEELLRIFVGCNGAQLSREDAAWKAVGDPTEGALLAAGGKGGVHQADLEKGLPKVAQFPFDSDRKRMTVVRRMPDGKARALVKGAPDALLGRCTRILDRGGVRPMTEADRQAVLIANLEMADKALRVLAAAYRDLDGSVPSSAEDVERDLVFVGLAGMQDPPRPEAVEAVKHCQSAGIRVVMITGDHPRTALAIARELGITKPGEQALTGAELDRLPDAELQARVSQVPVYARVTAEHKLRIVRAWKAHDAVVAMTGDGVNDAPAIKGADIGVAMGKSGTEVAKGASDMVITDDNFASIVAAVEEGRGIYDNIRKTIQYLLGGNIGELLIVASCVMLGLPMPLLPIHLLWINLVTDGLPALCLATDPIDPDVMRRRPRRRSEKITDGPFLVQMLLTGLLTGGVTLAIYVFTLRRESLEEARSMAFAVLVFAELFRSFGCRSETRPVWEVSLFSNLKLALVVFVSFLFQVWSHHNAWLGAFLKTPQMSWADCLSLVPLALIPLLVLEGFKLVRRRRGIS